MALIKETKQSIINEYKIHDNDTGSPEVQVAMLTQRINQLTEHLKQHKKDHQLKIIDYSPYYVNQNQNYLAIPNAEQLERKTKVLNDLKTYSTELAAKLALGQKSFDDWDIYIAELKKLGLDQLIEIDQQLLDRYFELK